MTTVDLPEKAALDNLYKAEKELSKHIEENNNLEYKRIEDLINYYSRVRPELIHSKLKKIELSVFGNDVVNSNIEALNIQKSAKIAELKKNNELKKQICNEKRNILLNIMKEINELSEENRHVTPNFNEVCSTDIESLAREFMDNIKDVDENFLVEYLARGKAKYTEEEEREKIQELGKFRYLLKTSEIITGCLEKACEVFSDSDQSSFDSLTSSQQSLIKLLEESSRQLDQHCPRSPDTVSDVNNMYQSIHRISSEIAPLRSNLVSLLSSNHPIPLPVELQDLDKEKEVLQKCIEAVSQSAQNMQRYLEQSKFVNYHIESYEDIRKLYDEYESLDLESSS